MPSIAIENAKNRGVSWYKIPGIKYEAPQNQIIRRAFSNKGSGISLNIFSVEVYDVILIVNEALA